MQETQNVMKQLRIEKLTLNIGMAKNLEKVEQVHKFIERVTGKKAVLTHAHKRSTFGSPKGRAQGVKITLRGEDAEKFLQKCFVATENSLKASKFDKQGSFSFGVKEYIDVPGMAYDPAIGVIGFEVMVTLTRPGFRVARRKIRPASIGDTHRISKEESIEFIRNKFKINID